MSTTQNPTDNPTSDISLTEDQRRERLAFFGTEEVKAASDDMQAQQFAIFTASLRVDADLDALSTDPRPETIEAYLATLEKLLDAENAMQATKRRSIDALRAAYQQQYPSAG